MHDAAHDAALVADDDAARERALDIGRSFLVQAPAGSGKTELLIQRYLALLAHVERPEQIVAVTFTRKAAGEMRERITAALRAAAAGLPVDSRHAERTRSLALAALARDTREGWQLLAHPSRLCVSTIDAIATLLTRQAPVATGLGASPRYEENAAPMYAAAARAALVGASANDRAWARLLAHLDNDAESMIALLAEMLAKRDQWIEIVAAAKREGFRGVIERALAAEIVGETGQAASLFPSTLLAELAERELDAAAHLAQSPEQAGLARHLADCAAHGGLPPATLAAQPLWRALTGWLLIARDPQFRSKVSTKFGFPAGGNGAGAAERQQRKAAMESLLRGLAAVPQLADALDAVRQLPPPHYTDHAWSNVEALLAVLPRAASELLRTFRESATVDFTQGTIGALAALGAEDAPTELLLKLDFQLRHLLIDEFQDTSFTQIELIRRLTSGWQPDDGRTLFAVGDPMQSIYRFRGAEVRLFVEAQQNHRVAELPVENLVLRRNFRSPQALVAWINTIFPDVLGLRSDPWRGTVGFTAAVAAQPPPAGEPATIEVFADAEAEARAVVGHVRAALAKGAERIAVLVRARAHLDPLLALLRSEGIAFAAVDLDPLAERQSILDLLSLTHALLQPADRLAWLAVLRAPWCGLTLADLLVIASAAQARCAGMIAGLITTREPVPPLSEDGSARWARITECLAIAMAARGRAGISARVRGAWLALGGPATLHETLDLDAAEQFFALLAEHDVGGEVPDWAAFVDALRWLYGESDVADAPLQVMTLHRAKGLEFDAVILPGLARGPGRGKAELLRWRRRPHGLLLAPTSSRGGVEDPLYEYLGRLAGEEESAELGRLLYVGCTRAKRRLHLTAVLDACSEDGAPPAWSPPPSGSALEKCWSACNARLGAPPIATGVTRSTPEGPLLARLPRDWKPPLPRSALPAVRPVSGSTERIPFDWAREAARHAGTVAHRLFAQVARDGLAAWDSARVAALVARVRAELAGEGVDQQELDGAATSVLDALGRLIADERGRWLFDPDHVEARSEWALAGIEDGAVAHVVIDRSFVADGVRWIVDFKTGAHEGADIDAFIDREVARYRDQLERYAHFVRGQDARPIRLGLYFPLQRAWREWSYED